MTHPLSDEILEQFGIIDDQCVEGERIFFDDDMRAAYDLGHKAGVKLVEDYLEDKLYVMPKVLRPTKKQEAN